MTEPTSTPGRRWKLRAAVAALWLAVGVLGVITHGSPISIVAGAVLALIFAYRAHQSYTATHTQAGP
jgi:hypothetical protein